MQGDGRVRRSLELYRRALELIPGGTQLVSRRPTRYANGVSPVYAARVSADTQLYAYVFPGIGPDGGPRALAGTELPFRSGDLAALGQLLADHKGRVAAVITEPLRSELPAAGYLEGVRKLCRDHGA